MLGPTAVWADRGRVALRSSPRRQLVELLAMHAGEPVPTDAIVAELWAGSPPECPDDAVRTLTRRVRRTFTELPLRDADQGYLLDLPPESVDALHMVMLTEKVKSAVTPDDEDVARTLEQALSLWAGEPFGGSAFGAQHATAVREWGEIRSLALRMWASAQLRLGRPKPVISRLRAERVGDFADEGLYKLLIDALGQVGREVEASAGPGSREVGARGASIDQDWKVPAHPADWTDDQADGRSSR